MFFFNSRNPNSLPQSPFTFSFKNVRPVDKRNMTI